MLDNLKVLFIITNNNSALVFCLKVFGVIAPLFVFQSRDQGLDVEPTAAGGPGSMYSSLSTLSRSQYPTLPVGASTANGMWPPPYPMLARSPSAGDQSDSVFLESPDDPSLPPASPDRYCRDPTYSNDSQGELETDGPGLHPPQHSHHSLPRQSHGGNRNHVLPGELDHSLSSLHQSPRVCCFCLFLSRLRLSHSSEYVNQEIQDLRPGILERPTTLPRKGSRADRRLPNGLSSGHSVENPGYLIPVGTRTPTSPAFDNPYYLDHLAKAKTSAGASGVNDFEGLETDGVMPRHVNGFVTPTAENPEYLGLVDTLSGHT